MCKMYEGVCVCHVCVERVLVQFSMRKVYNVHIYILCVRVRYVWYVWYACAGGRTPSYGYMTPSHDPSQTPQHSSSAWDPSVANTPHRSVCVCVCVCVC